MAGSQKPYWNFAMNLRWTKTKVYNSESCFEDALRR